MPMDQARGSGWNLKEWAIWERLCNAGPFLGQALSAAPSLRAVTAVQQFEHDFFRPEIIPKNGIHHAVGKRLTK